jgi:serine/threonine-protein kinase
MPLLTEGQKIVGTYEVERFLGEGAFAEVYRVRHRFLGRQAMKVFKMVGMTARETEELLSEALLLSGLRHPNIVNVLNADTTETSRGRCGFFTMEYVAGGTLEKFWRSHGRQLVPVQKSVDILCQVCRGLGVAHSESPPIVHRDIKPQNILVGYDRSGILARVCDFGLAKRVNPLTLAATTRGSKDFKPPEAFGSSGSDSCAGDVWALGSILYLMLTDRLPYVGSDSGDVPAERRFVGALVPPSRLNVNVDAFLDEVLFRALALEQEKRYPNSMEFLRDLSAWERRPHAPDREGKPGAPLMDSKSALGGAVVVDEEAARQTVRQATDLARRGRLTDAADMLEEALNLAPRLREAWDDQLKLWRRGVVA